MGNKILTHRARPNEGVVFTPAITANGMVNTAFFWRLKSDFSRLTKEIFSDFINGKIPEDQGREILNKISQYSIIDPAIGDGAFPFALYYNLVKWRNHYDISNGEDAIYNIIGYDIDCNMVDICRKQLPITPKLITGDFLRQKSYPRGDIIIGNPPYVRQELLQIEYKNALVENARGDWPGLKINARSDMYLYFILKALKIMKPGGILTFIVPNGWLDSEYGQSLRELLSTEMELLEVEETTGQRHFSVEVNTIIMTVRKSKPLFERKIIVRTETGENLIEPAGANKLGLSWSGIYLRCPEWLRHFVNDSTKLCRLRDVFRVQTGIITGNNAKYYSPDFASDKSEPAIRTPREVSSIIFRRDDSHVRICTAGVPYKIHRAPLLWADLRGGRHVVVWNCDNLPHEHTFYGLKPNNPADPKIWVALLNSTWVWLMVEIFGRCSLGGGAIRMVKSDLVNLPLPELPGAVLPASVAQFFRRPIDNWRTELNQPDRREIDRLIFLHLGLADRYSECVELVDRLMTERAVKGRS